MAFHNVGDKDIMCKDCGDRFVDAASAQEYRASMGWDTPPRRCPNCRRKRKQELENKHGRDY